MWGKVGLLGLSIKNRDLLTDFRELVEKQVTDSTKFSIYPRDALEKKGNVSVLLRETYRGLDVTLLPRAIFRRNRALRGGLKVTHVKHYGDDERSRTGAPKRGWRLVLLQGDATFMESLERFEPEHRFWVGSDRIIIRGGNRKSQTAGQERPGQGNVGGSTRPGSRQLPWQGRGQQQQQSHLNQTAPGRGRNNQDYERDFPRSGNMSRSSRRGTGTGPRSADAIRGAPVWGESTRGGSN